MAGPEAGYGHACPVFMGPLDTSATTVPCSHVIHGGGITDNPSETCRVNMATLALVCVASEQVHYDTMYCNGD